MDYKIKTLGDLRVIGFKDRQTPENNAIEKLWTSVNTEGHFERLMEINDGELKGSVGVCTNYAEDISFDYIVGVVTSKDLEGTEELIIPASKYVVFTCTIPEIHDLTMKIYNEWIDTVDYEFSYGPEIEFYPDMNSCEIYVPIK